MSKPECYCTSIREAGRRLTAAYDDALAPTGVNVAQFGLLRELERSGTMSLTEFGVAMELDRSTIGRNVKVLERMGLVVILPGEEDRRESAVGLSPTGRAVLRKGLPMWIKAQKSIEARIGRDNAERLRSVLHKL